MVSRYSSTGGWNSCGWRGAPRFSGMAVGARGRHVERRVAVYEAEGDQREPGVLDRHDRPVLGPGDVRDAERMPQHDVGVDDRTILRRPGRQPGAPCVLVGVVPRGTTLLGVEGRDPEVVGGKG